MTLIDDLREAAIELDDLAADTHSSEACPRTGRCDANIEDHVARLRDLASSCRKAAEQFHQAA